MEELAYELYVAIDTICGSYHIYKDEKVLEKSNKIIKQVQQYCSFFLQGNIFGIEEEEYNNLKEYVIGVLQDFVTATQNEDTVLMLDTLDYGLRQLIDIYRNDKEEVQ